MEDERPKMNQGFWKKLYMWLTGEPDPDYADLPLADGPISPTDVAEYQHVWIPIGDGLLTKLVGCGPVVYVLSITRGTAQSTYMSKVECFARRHRNRRYPSWREYISGGKVVGGDEEHSSLEAAVQHTYEKMATHYNLGKWDAEPLTAELNVRKANAVGKSHGR